MSLTGLSAFLWLMKYSLTAGSFCSLQEQIDSRITRTIRVLCIFI